MLKRFVCLSTILVMLLSIMTNAFAQEVKTISDEAKKVLIVVSPKDFNDQEFFEVKQILNMYKANSTVASTSVKTATSMDGRTVKVDIKISDARLNDYDAVVVIGGIGVPRTLWNNKDLINLVTNVNSNKKIVAAVSEAPVVLAKAGVLKNKNATVYPDNEAVKVLKKYGAKYVNQETIISDNIITGRDEKSSKEFGLKIIKALKLDNSNINIIMVIPQKDFKDKELFEPKTIFEMYGAKVTIASNTKDKAVGMDGGVVTPDMLISDIEVDKLDALIFVGGTGVIEYIWDNQDLKNLIIEAVSKDKLIGAICLAPVVLANAGVLKDKPATMYPWDEQVKKLENGGARYIDQEVIEAGNIITGRNPDASKAFGLKIAKVLGLGEKQKKILMVIAPKDFKDQELFETETIFEINGANVTVASTTTEKAIGMDGSIVTPDIKISDAKASDYDAIVLVGGSGVTESLWSDASLKKLLIDANNQYKVIGAICLSPVALAKTGLLKDKYATMYPWDQAVNELLKYSVKYLDQEVVVEDNLITGRNPEASKAFALKISDILY